MLLNKGLGFFIFAFVVIIMILDPREELKDVSVVVEKVLEEFEKPSYENIFLLNLGYLRENSYEKDFLPKYNFSPQTVSYEEYLDKNLYPIILVVNNCPTIFKFHISYLKKIIVPRFDVIRDMVLSSLTGA